MRLLFEPSKNILHIESSPFKFPYRIKGFNKTNSNLFIFLSLALSEFGEKICKFLFYIN